MVSLPSRAWSVSPAFMAEGDVLKLECSSDVPLKYCRFYQPDGKTFESEATSSTVSSGAHSHASFR